MSISKTYRYYFNMISKYLSSFNSLSVLSKNCYCSVTLKSHLLKYTFVLSQTTTTKDRSSFMWWHGRHYREIWRNWDHSNKSIVVICVTRCHRIFINYIKINGKCLVKTAFDKQMHATKKKLCRQNLIVILQIYCTSKAQNVGDLKTAQHLG